MSEHLEPAEVGILLAGLTDASVEVRVAMFEALSRLPLAAADWRTVGVYAVRVLTVGESSSERGVVIDAAPAVPVRSVREQVAGLVDSDDPALRRRAVEAVIAMGHPSAVPELLDRPVGAWDLYKIALADVSGMADAVRAAFEARAGNEEDRFWLALALALSGEDEGLRRVVAELPSEGPSWHRGVVSQVGNVLTARRLPDPTLRWLSRLREPNARELAVALTEPPDMLSYPLHSGTALRPGWSSGRNPGFSTGDARLSDNADLPDIDDLYAFRYEYERGEAAEAYAAIVRRVESSPVIVTLLMARAASQGGGWFHANAIVDVVESAQGRYRPDVDGLFAVYLDVTRRAWRDYRREISEEIAIVFGHADDEGGPRSFCYQIGWLVSRGGLPGLIPALAAHLRSQDPAERIAAAYLVADAAAYATQVHAAKFGGGFAPDRPPVDVLEVDVLEGDVLPERRVAMAVIDSHGSAPTEPLTPGLGYLLWFTIGAELFGDIVRFAPPFPIAQLQPTVTEGWWLTITVHGDGVDVPPGPHPIFLPVEGPAWACRCRPDGPHSCRAGDRWTAVDLPFHAPDESRIAAAVVKVYAGATLVQALEVTLPVGEVGALRPSALVVYSLSAELDDVVHRAPRDFSVLSEAGCGQGHRLHVNGLPGPPVVFELVDAAAAEAARHLRSLLFASHLVREGERWTSLYGPRHGTDRATYTEDLRRLAVAGSELFVGVFGGRGAAVQARLAEVGRRTGRPAELQVARAINTRLTVPWQLMYDEPIDDVRAPMECPSVVEFGPGAAVLDVSPVCPHVDAHDRTGTLCPFGFWGLAHHVECPPPMFTRALPEVTGDERPADLTVALHPDLATGAWTDHDRVLRSLGGRPAVQDVDALRTSVLMGTDVLYFYCHGARVVRAGSAATRPVLDLGRGGQLSPLTLNTWVQGEPQVRWERRRPLVVLNGCHTGEVLPDVPAELLTAFVDVLGAAGVVATEIAVEATLAATAMELFLQELFSGQSVGAAMRSMRWALLARGNILGLAYAAYCDTRLRLPAPSRAEGEPA